MQTKTSQRESLFSRVVALFVAFVLATSFVNFGAIGVNKAWADDEKQTVTLQVVTGVSSWMGPTAAVNKTFAIQDGATMGDLFEAAVADGSLAAFDFGSTYDGKTYYLSSITPAGASAVADGGYWMSKTASDPYAALDRDAALAVGETYRFYWSESNPGLAPSDDQWTEIKKTAVKSEIVAGGGAAAGTATLLVVPCFGWGADGFGPQAATAATFDFAKDAKVSDLFAAAVSDKKLSAFDFGNTYDGETYYLSSITPAGASAVADGGNWMSGVYADPAAYTNRDTALADGTTYLFYWEGNAPGIDPTEGQWAELSKAAVLSGEQVNVSVEPSPYSSSVDAAELNSSLKSVYREVFANIKSGLNGVGGYGQVGEQQYMEIAACAVGAGSSVNKTNVFATAQDAFANYPSSLPFAALQVAAMGADPTAAALPDGSTANLIDKLADTNMATQYITVPAYALLAYASGPYAVDKNKMSSAYVLINQIASQQDASGGWSTEYGVDTTAMIIPALAAYSDNETAAASLAKAVSYLKSQQKTDGSFGNANSTAVAIVALCSVGEDPSKGENSALKALLAQATSAKDGFTYEGQANDLATAQGFLALAAYQGMVNTGKAYNVYTQAKLGQAVVPEQPQVKVDATETQEQIVGVTGLDAAVEAIQDDPEFAGQTIKSIELKVSDKDVSEADAAAIKELAGECDGLLLFDVSLIATTDKGTVDIGGKAYSMIGFTCTFDFAGKDNIKVFRVHDGKAVELASEPNKDGYFQMDKENGTITIYSMVFSSFGVSYDKVATQDADPSVSAKTSDPMDVAPLAVLALGSLVTLCVATRRLNGSAE